MNQSIKKLFYLSMRTSVSIEVGIRTKRFLIDIIRIWNHNDGKNKKTINLIIFKMASWLSGKGGRRFNSIQTQQYASTASFDGSFKCTTMYVLVDSAP